MTGPVETPMSKEALKNMSVFSLMGLYVTMFKVPVKKYVGSAINTLGWSKHCNGHIKHHILYSPFIINGFISTFNPQ